MHWIFLLAALPFTAVAGTQPSVTIENGTVLGVDLPQFDQSIFLGIPYAQPPVGDLRLRTPRSIKETTKVFWEWFRFLRNVHAGYTLPSNICTGQMNLWKYKNDNSGFNNSEDCLTLNVIRPDGVSESSLVPVVVWIHGGGLVTGGSADFHYNGSWIVQASGANGNPIVFVSINYRLASLGFLASKALEDEGSLNLGVRDQRLALHWVQENIAKFGGNPEKVTIQGQSVHTQIIVYGGRDDKLFNQAICESGDGGNFSLPDSEPFQATYDALLGNTTCASTANLSEAAQLSCIRSLPIETFRENLVGTTGIVFDGDFINVAGAVEAYTTGKWVKVAFLIGSCTDEGLRDTILDLYPNDPSLGCPFNTGDFQLDPVQNGFFSTPGLQNKRVSAITGDVIMAAGPRWLGQLISSQVPFYKYRFNHKPYSVTFSVEDFIGHFTEVGYVFNTQNNDTDFWLTNHFTATYLGSSAPIEDRFLGVYMSRSWASFIATGDPNNVRGVPSKITWPKYSDGQENLVWQTQGSITEKDVSSMVWDRF
ncbi:alpha/beta-hydrolase [Mycena maculata]|uniref:Alpha/beta-hydrolase n=1 Tax=Mycena maculata TaxID=230809 RepID=A0AAD7IFV0_9AGAR|nr:alpha/beta-hydrolase [Mycena maculata]